MPIILGFTTAWFWLALGSLVLATAILIKLGVL